MDGQCIYFVPPFFNNTCELLNDIPEPSLTSLDESLGSDSCHPLKDESFSDGEAVCNNNTMMTSTPQRRVNTRRSVSLVDVSKIDDFTSRPLGNILASWETMGSQSSVGKSRDSGYVHSGSLLSVNSGKLSEMKMGSDQVHTILEECSRLKQELEYSEILINTLQETNNDLRIKCAAAHNRISELRLNCANHCDCCSKQTSNILEEPNASSDSLFLVNSDSSSPESSRSSSPERNPCMFDTFNQLENEFHTSLSKVDESVESDEKLCPEEGARNLLCVKQPGIYSSQSHIGEQIVHSSRESDNSNSSNRQENEEKVLQLNSVDNSCIENSAGKELSTDFLNKQLVLSSIKPPDNFEKSRHSSVEDLIERTVEEEEISLPEDEPIFVANEMNGKIWVGSFKVWGDSSIRVASKSPLLSQSFSSVNQISCSPFESPVYNPSRSYNNISDDKRKFKESLPSSNNVKLKLSGTSPSVRCVRPVSACSPLSNSPDVRSRKISLPNNPVNSHPLNNQDYKFSFHPVTDFKQRNLSTKMDSVNITVSSQSDHCQLKISSNSHIQCTSPPLKPNIYSWPEDSKHSLRDSSLGRISQIGSSNDESEPVSKVRSTSPYRNTCQMNLSSLGVSVTKSPNRSVCPEKWSVLDKWNLLKSKVEKMAVGSSVSSDSSDKSTAKIDSTNNFISIIDQSPSLLNQSKLISNSSSTNADSLVVSTLAPLNSSFGKENSLNVVQPSQSMQECLEKANEFARELSRGLSRLPPRLDYIQSIGRP